MTTPVMDITKALESLSKRIYTLEQRLTSPAYAIPNGSSPTFGTVIIGGEGGVLVTATPDAPTDLSLSTSSNFDDIFITAEWLAPADGSAVGYELFWYLQDELDPLVWDLVNSTQTSGTSRTVGDLLPGRTYGFQVRARSAAGVLSPPEPAVGYETIVADVDATIPTDLTGFAVTAGPGSIVALWDDSADPDLAHYRIQVDDNADFSSPIHDQTTTSSIVAFTDLSPDTLVHVRVRPVDTSGNEGDWTATADITTGTVTPGPDSIDGTMLQDGVIADNHIVLAGLSAATIKFGTMSGDRITANTLDVGAIKTGTISARTITLAVDGILRGLNSGGGTGWSLNQDGFKIYDALGNPTVTLNRDGSASFKGTIVAGSTISASISANQISGGTITGVSISGVTITGGLIQTAASGTRVSINSAYGDRIEFFSGQASQSIAAGIYGQTSASYSSLFIYSGQVSSGNTGVATITVRSGRTDGTGTTIDILANATTISGSLSASSVSASILYDSGYRPYSPINPPPSAPVTSVNGQTGAVSLVTGVSSVNGLTGAVALSSIQYSTESNYTYNMYNSFGGSMTMSADGSYVRMLLNGTAQFRAQYGAQCNWTGSKTFVIPHPRKADRFLVHAASEGPTADVHYRGVGRLDGTLEGKCVIELPDYFEALTKPEGRTIMLTPMLGCDPGCPTMAERGDRDYVVPNLAASTIVDGKFVVKYIGGWQHNCARFFWEVRAVRKDVEQFEVEPSMDDYTLRGDGPYTYLTAKSPRRP